MATILIIEDDPVFGELLVMHLEDSGHDPHLVRSVSEARESLTRTAPDAVLLDQQLPDLAQRGSFLDSPEMEGAGWRKVVLEVAALHHPGGGNPAFDAR